MNKFSRFCLVGTIGFVIDAGIFQLLVVSVHTNFYAARIFSFLIAASATWLMNRRYTFKVNHEPTRPEWLRYIGLMLFGALVNYGAFALCISFSLLAYSHPWVAVAVGSIAGLGVNFATSNKFWQAKTDRNLFVK